jgi:hypothetical protein
VPIIDRAGTIEDAYKKFEKDAGCEGKGFKCLRSASPEALKSANDKSNLEVQPGLFAFGPNPDGKYIIEPPTLAFANGNVWQNISSAISQHVRDEESIFAEDTLVTNDTLWTGFLQKMFPIEKTTSPLYKKLVAQYPFIDAPGSPYKDEETRMNDFVSLTRKPTIVLELTMLSGSRIMLHMQ